MSKDMLNTTRIRLYPTEQQAQGLAVQFGCARWVYNNALAVSGELYRATGRGLNYHAMAVRLPKLKQEFEWLGSADSQVLQQSLQNLARAYENFFAKRAKYPRFKTKHGRQSIQYPQRVKIDKSRIHLPKVGWVRCVAHRETPGAMKTVTVSQNACGQYHAAILTDDGEALPKVSTEGKAVGLDVGLSHLAVTSDGSKFENPRHLKRAESNLKRKQRKLSRKKKGSSSRKRAKRQFSRAHERVACARRDHLHKLSRRIVNENQVIAVEDINVKGIMQNHNLAKATADVGWGILIGFIEYKAAREGKAFVKCDRWYPSSKTCNTCGLMCDKMPLGIRSWSCTGCGAPHDRDTNAAKNIRDEGLRILAAGTVATAGGGNVRPSTRRNPRSRRSPMKPEASAFKRGQFTPSRTS